MRTSVQTDEQTNERVTLNIEKEWPKIGWMKWHRTRCKVQKNYKSLAYTYLYVDSWCCLLCVCSLLAVAVLVPSWIFWFWSLTIFAVVSFWSHFSRFISFSFSDVFTFVKCGCAHKYLSADTHNQRITWTMTWITNLKMKNKKTERKQQNQQQHIHERRKNIS